MPWSLLRRCAFVGALIATAAVAHADDIGAEAAKRLLGEGRIRPLADILEGVKAVVPGELMEVELEVEDGLYVYDIKLLGPNGRVQEVEADALTGKVLKVEDDD